MRSGWSAFHSSGLSPEARPTPNRFVPVAPSASSGRSSARSVCSMVVMEAARKGKSATVKRALRPAQGRRGVAGVSAAPPAPFAPRPELVEGHSRGAYGPAQWNILRQAQDEVLGSQRNSSANSAFTPFYPRPLRPVARPDSSGAACLPTDDYEARPNRLQETISPCRTSPNAAGFLFF